MNTIQTPTPSGIQSFYRACLAALQAVEARTPTGRRFGADADAMWSGFKGHLCAADRIDLLLRDSAVAWPSAYSGARVFAVDDVAEDEPFGARWESLDPVDAEDVWRDLAAAPEGSAFDVLRACARAWSFELSPVEVGAVDANTRLLVVGPSAVASVANVFAEGSDLDWGEQVICAATLPGHRHIAGLAASIINSARETAVVSPDDGAVEELGRIDRVVAGQDAYAGDLDWAGLRDAD